ncbi:MAG TPA: sensor histidine kinase [Blastocatellia bacterium]|nr:sensor histidine kinase [Blastocatellia bacterium]
MRNLTRKFLLWFGCCLAVSLFFSTRIFFSQTGMGGPADSYFGALQGALVWWFTWGALSLVIIRIARRIAPGRSLLQRLSLHLPLSFLLTAAFFLIAFLTDALVRGRLAAGITSDPMLAFASIKQSLGGAFQWNYLIYWLIAGGWMAWDYNRESQDRKLQAAQLELKTAQLEQRLTEARLLNLKAQLHPHFLFNALNTISAFVEKDSRGARRMIEHLGDLLRFSLEHSEEQETTLAAELAALDHYLAIQRVRFEDHLQLRMEIAPDALPAAVPSLILQPLVENAIRHSVAQQTTPVCVTILAAMQDGHLRVQVGDDGPGLPADWRWDAHAGVGLTNTKQRLEQLYPAAHQLNVGNAEGGGVTVEIILPFHTNGAKPEEDENGKNPSDHRG